jgi:quinol monooxygenase YgiN
MELMRSQAAASLLEEGCLLFQIWTESSRSDEVFLWEVYSNRAAFDMHLESSHFVEFERKTADLVVAKSELTWDTKAG